MISVDEIALVKDRVAGKERSLSVAGVASLRQLELLFLVAHDEVQRLEKFESRARLVAEKWELLSSSKLIAMNELPAGFSAVVTTNDRARCQHALEILYGPDHDVIVAIKIRSERGISSTNEAEKHSSSADNNNNGGISSVPQVSPVKKVASPKKKRNPQVYVDDEFSYDDIGNNNNNHSVASDRDSVTNRSSVSRENSPNRPPPPPAFMAAGAGSGSPSSRTGSPAKQNNNNSIISNQNNNTNINVSLLNNNNNYLDTLACCKFISALPKVVFELAFHREGEYADVALAAALDELKLFESQLRSSQESFENIRSCWNHELQTLSRESGEDLFEARVVDTVAASTGNENENAMLLYQQQQQQTQQNLDEDGNQYHTEVTTSHSAPATVDQLAPCETTDGRSWLAPPLLPLRHDFAVNSEELFAGYCGPTLLGPVVSRGALYDQISNLIMKNLEAEETGKRAEILDLAREEFAELLLIRSAEAESMWKEVVYEKTALNLRLLEAKEEARKLRNQVGAMNGPSTMSNVASPEQQ